EGVGEVAGKAFVDLHRGLAHLKGVGRKSGELHRVLQQAWAGRETGSRQVGRAWIVLADRAQDAVVVESGTADDLEELIGDSELHVPPGVGQEVRRLTLASGGTDDLGDGD